MALKGREIKGREINRDIAKKLAIAPKPTKKQQRYVRIDNIDKRKAGGWKVVKETKIQDLHAGARSKTSDLVLMEK